MVLCRMRLTSYLPNESFQIYITYFSKKNLGAKGLKIYLFGSKANKLGKYVIPHPQYLMLTLLQLNFSSSVYSV